MGFSFSTKKAQEAAPTSNKELQLTKGEVEALQSKLTQLRHAIEPLLKNLELNPEKAYIHWPDRTTKVKAFRSRLDSIQKL